MLPGPVFAFEMLTTSRRGRLYAMRAVYAMLLLLFLWMVHSLWASSSTNGTELPVRMIRWFGLSMLGGIVGGQGILILLLTPTLVSGAIADEKRRKTLHYLLASRLTGPEIVLGKLMVRMLYLGVLLSVSFPVMSLLVLLGGIDPMLVILGAAGLLSMAWFLAALSIWVSTIARRPREALFITFGLEALWLILPPIVHYSTAPTGSPWLDDALHLAASWVGASGPILVVGDAIGPMITTRAYAWEQPFAWMIGLQAGAGLILALLAAVQLRPIFKRQDGAVRRTRGLRALLARRRWRWHRPVGERPMLWKELHTSRPRGFARLVGGLLVLILGGLLLYNGISFGRAAYDECITSNPNLPRNNWSTHWKRWAFEGFLGWVSPLVYVVGILTIAGAAAASIASEHEDDTWISLTATDLTGREIVRAKLLGAMWKARRLGAVIVLLMIAGAYVDSLHPLSIAAMPVVLLVYAWFAAALGMSISMRLRSTWRAQFLTIALLLLFNVIGQGLVNLFAPMGYGAQVWPGFTPYEVSKLVMAPDFFDRLAGDRWPRFWRPGEIDSGPAWLAFFSVTAPLVYAMLAALLTRDAVRRFEVAAGRARRIKAATASSPAGTPDPAGLAQIC
jgi:ABC-type transport system involved in multi-copper enzyme maturation permease subunit